MFFFFIGLVLFLTLMGRSARGGDIRRHLFHYILAAVLINLVGIIAYTLLLALEGSTRFGQAATYSFPEDLIAKGWGALPEVLIVLFGVGLTVFAAVNEARHTKRWA
jgi:uncharacterized membrane protein YdjX (TVP38/TMEM64 family)